jgi:thiamine kinase-like enzyme
LTVPASASELTTEWLRAALAAVPGSADFRLHRAEPIGVGYGLASANLRCHLAGAGAPSSVIVKLWSTEPPAGATEVLFYLALGGRVGIRIPSCHHAAIDEASGRGVLVLEDFPAAIQGDCLEDLDAAGAQAMARLLATLHATWWGSEELAAMDWLPAARAVVRGPEWFRRKRPEFLERFGARVGPAVRRLVDHAESAQERANALLAAAPVTLLHGDLHLDNVLFAGGSDDAVVLDWARVARGPAALDLAELVFSMAPPVHFDLAVAAYLDELRRRGVSGPDEDALRLQLGGALLRMVVRGTCGISAWRPASPREWRILERSLERLDAAVEAWRERHPALL